MKAALKVIAVNAAVLLAGLVLIELVFGNWVFGPDYRDLNIPRGTQRLFDVSNLYPGGTITYTRDEHGLREPYPDIASIDILTLGGSTTNQLYVDDAKTWHAVLRGAFAADGRNISVVNAAVDGQSTRGHIAVFERWFPLIENLHARYILVYAGINDVALVFAEQYDDMRAPQSMRRFAKWIKNKSALYDLYRTLRGIVAAYDAHLVHEADWVSPTAWERWQPADREFQPPADMAARLGAYRDRLRRLADEIRRFGARAIFVTQPTGSYRIRDGWIELPSGNGQQTARGNFLELDAFNRTLLETCREEKAVCIDLAREVSFEDGDFYDRVHNSDSGAAKIGLYLHRKLKTVM